MVGYNDTFGVAKKAAEVAHKKSNNWPMGSFIYDGSEITTLGWGIASKTKTQNPKKHF